MATNTPQLRFPEFNDEWQEKKIGEVSEIGRGKSKHRPRDADYLYGGKYPFVQTGDIKRAELYLTEFSQTYSEEGLKQSKLWSENTLCITIAANIAETAILKIKACFPDSIIGLIPKEDSTIVLFVKHLFDKYKLQIQNLSQGAAQDNLNQEKLSNISFSFPTLPEQTKIANFLTAVDEKIQVLRKKKELTQQYKKGIMQRIFSQELRFTDENGNSFPDWEEKKLVEVAELTSSKRVHSSDYVKNGIPFFRGKEISVLKNKNLPTDLLYISEEQYKQLKEAYGVPQINDILITAVGTLGNIYQVINNDRFYFKDGNLIWMKNIKECSPFLAVLLSFHHEKVLSTSIGSSQKALTMEALNKLNFNFPSLPEQTKIANFLSAIDERIALIDTQLQQAEAWKKGLLQQMFC